MVPIINTKVYENGVRVYNAIFACLAFPICGLVLFLIVKKSPNTFQDYKIVLFNSTFNLLITAILSVFLQGRVLSTPDVYALVPVGPCALFRPEVCFVTYNLFSASVINGVMSTALAMHFRYSVIHTEVIPRKRLIRNILISSIIPISMLITPHLASFEFDIVMASTIHTYPQYDLRAYGPFGGFKSIRDPIFQWNTLILLSAAYILPILILWWRRKILKMLQRNERMFSPSTVNSTRILVKVLTYQTLLPVICYIPNVTHFVFVSIFQYRFQITEYTPTLISGLPCIFDPLLTIYFIAPYRIWVKEKLKRKNHVTNNVQSISIPVNSGATPNS